MGIYINIEGINTTAFGLEVANRPLYILLISFRALNQHGFWIKTYKYIYIYNKSAGLRPAPLTRGFSLSNRLNY